MFPTLPGIVGFTTLDAESTFRPLGTDRLKWFLADFIPNSNMAFDVTHNSSSLVDVHCPKNCSSRGACEGGICTCYVQFTGSGCERGNLTYNCFFGSLFYLLALVSICQLFFCIRSEYKKKRVLKDAFEITTQKTLYVLTAMATVIRGTYFYIIDFIPDRMADNILSTYYPLILSCLCLLVCFWAEMFHLSAVSFESSRFLTKSIHGFGAVNIVLYTLIITQFIITELYRAQSVYCQFLQDIFKGCFAVFMFLVLVAFLFYGIAMYFKAQGSLPGPVNQRQICMSRFGLLCEALLQLSIVVILTLQVGKYFSQANLTIMEQNFLDVVFQVVELGAALWFPCVLWNVKCPEQLWILNPKKLLNIDHDERSRLLNHDRPATPYNTFENQTTSQQSQECWICYEGNVPRLGPFIRPCKCRGDVGTVHHGCLLKWLIESQDNPEKLCCRVCKEEYHFCHGRVWLPHGFTKLYWFLVTVAIFTSLGFPVLTHFVCNLVPSTYFNIIMIGTTFLIEYICLKSIGIIIIRAYRRAKISSMQILVPSSTTSSDNLTVQEEVADQRHIQIQVDVHRP